MLKFITYLIIITTSVTVWIITISRLDPRRERYFIVADERSKSIYTISESVPIVWSIDGKILIRQFDQILETQQKQIDSKNDNVLFVPYGDAFKGKHEYIDKINSHFKKHQNSNNISQSATLIEDNIVPGYFKLKTTRITSFFYASDNGVYLFGAVQNEINHKTIGIFICITVLCIALCVSMIINAIFFLKNK